MWNLKTKLNKETIPFLNTQNKQVGGGGGDRQMGEGEWKVQVSSDGISKSPVWKV